MFLSIYEISVYEPSLEEWLTQERVVDIFFGAYKDTQALYVIQNGGESNSILRIRYEGSAPVAVLEVENNEDTTTSEKQISVGEKVGFDGRKSFDLDGDDLIFQWDFGDGSDSRTNSSNPSHIYKTPGEYTVILVVTNSRGQANMASTTVVVEDSLNPTAVMLSPGEGDSFAVGQKLRLKAEAFDAEGKRIPDDQMTWSIRQYHTGGFDFLMDERSGNDFKLDPFPDADDSASKETLFLRVVLFVTNDNGLITKVERDIYPDTGGDAIPDTVTVNLVTLPEGLKISVGDNELTAPTQIQSFANLPVQVTPEQYPYRFQQWSDGVKDPSRDTVVSSEEASAMKTTLTYEAIFCLVDDAPCMYATTSCCGGYCDESGLCRTEDQHSVITDATQSTGISSTMTTEGELKSQDADGDDTSLKHGKNEESNGEENTYGYGVTASWKYFVCLSVVALLLVCLFYFGAKYFRLKRKLKKQKKYSSQQEQAKRLKSEEATSSQLENNSTCGGESESYDSFSSDYESSDFSSMLGKLPFDAEKALPRTPETMQSIDSPSHLDQYDSPSSILNTHIDETLVKLDDLLTKCFTRKPKSGRKKARNDEWLEEYAEESNGDVTENNDLTPIWLSSNKESAPGSPLRENSNASCMESMFPVSSLYSSGPFQDDPNESQALHLQDETWTSTNRVATDGDEQQGQQVENKRERPWDEGTTVKSDGSVGEQSQKMEETDDLAGDRSVRSDSSSISIGRQSLINKADDLISAWAETDNSRSHEVV